MVFGGVVYCLIVPVWKCEPERLCACDENEIIGLLTLMFELKPRCGFPLRSVGGSCVGPLCGLLLPGYGGGFQSCIVPINIVNVNQH